LKLSQRIFKLYNWGEQDAHPTRVLFKKICKLSVQELSKLEETWL